MGDSGLRAINRTFKALFLIGSLILLFGFVIVWIPEAGISGLNQQLSQATLNSEKVGLERVISVESLNLVTFYQPMSNILESVGSIVIGYSILITTFGIALKDHGKVQFQDVSQSEPLKLYSKLDYEKIPSLSQET
jgi:hypothetical protein